MFSSIGRFWLVSMLLAVVIQTLVLCCERFGNYLAYSLLSLYFIFDRRVAKLMLIMYLYLIDYILKVLWQFLRPLYLRKERRNLCSSPVSFLFFEFLHIELPFNNFPSFCLHCLAFRRGFQWNLFCRFWITIPLSSTTSFLYFDFITVFFC